jgi:hypothetical protein
MGQLLFPVFEKPIDTPATKTTGELLAASLDEVEAIAEEQEIPGLFAFGDQREIPDDFEGNPDELDEVMGPCTDWYDAKAGASAMRALGKLLVKSGMADAKELSEELEDLAVLLEAAAVKGVRFRLDLR